MRSGWDRCSERCKVAICGIKYIDLTKETIKILVVFFSYDKNLQLENNFRKTILNIKKILKMWRQMNLTLEGKMIVFKTLTLSKNYFLGSRFTNSKSDYRRIATNTKNFLWNSSSPKVKHETICKDFQYEGLINIEIKSKIIGLQCSWIKKTV